MSPVNQRKVMGYGFGWVEGCRTVNFNNVKKVVVAGGYYVRINFVNLMIPASYKIDLIQGAPRTEVQVYDVAGDSWSSTASKMCSRS